MRTKPGICTAVALTLWAGAATAQPTPVPQPTAPPVTAVQARAAWTPLGVNVGNDYIGPVTRTRRGTRLAWDVTLFIRPITADGRSVAGMFFLREYDCDKAAVRILYSVQVTDTEVFRWDRVEPTDWLPEVQVRAETRIKAYNRVCGG